MKGQSTAEGADAENCEGKVSKGSIGVRSALSVKGFQATP
jgi:hypothetical protein